MTRERTMNIQPYDPQDIYTAFKNLPQYRYFCENDLTTNWSFLKGHCLEVRYSDSKHCHCRPPWSPVTRREQWHGRSLPCMYTGCCARCKSAGTVGYECQDCHEDVYRMFRKTKEGKEYIVQWMGSIKLAERYDRDVHMIVYFQDQCIVKN